jgi:hypothetical protein
MVRGAAHDSDRRYGTSIGSIGLSQPRNNRDEERSTARRTAGAVRWPWTSATPLVITLVGKGAGTRPFRKRPIGEAISVPKHSRLFRSVVALVHVRAAAVPREKASVGGRSSTGLVADRSRHA